MERKNTTRMSSPIRHFAKLAGAGLALLAGGLLVARPTPFREARLEPLPRLQLSEVLSSAKSAAGAQADAASDGDEAAGAVCDIEGAPYEADSC